MDANPQTMAPDERCGSYRDTAQDAGGEQHSCLKHPMQGRELSDLHGPATGMHLGSHVVRAGLEDAKEPDASRVRGVLTEIEDAIPGANGGFSPVNTRRRGHR